MATKKSRKQKQADSDFNMYEEYSKSASKNNEKANRLASESTRIMGTLNYLGGKKAGDAAEASRRKRLSMADEQAQYDVQNAARKRKDYLKSSNDAYEESKLKDVNKHKWKGKM